MYVRHLGAVLAVIGVLSGSVFVTAANSPEVDAQIRALLAQVELLQAQLRTLTAGVQSAPVVSAPVTSASVCFSGTRTIARGSTGSDVQALQEYLRETADYTGDITGYFGPLTEIAVQRWQERNGVVSEGTPETTGFGIVGPRTREEMLGRCAIASSAVPVARSCLVDDVHIPANESRVLYSKERVLPGEGTCAQFMAVRTCTNGTLSGDDAFQFSHCENGPVGSCAIGGTSIPNGARAELYSQTTVSGGSCAGYAQVRTCTNGVLSGSAQYQYPSCTSTASEEYDINALLDSLMPRTTNTAAYVPYTPSYSSVAVTTSTTTATTTQPYTPYIPPYTENNMRASCMYGASVYPSGTQAEGTSVTQLCLGLTQVLCINRTTVFPRFECRDGLWRELGTISIDTSTTQYNTCSPGSSNDCHFCPLAGYGYWTTAVCP